MRFYRHLGLALLGFLLVVAIFPLPLYSDGVAFFSGFPPAIAESPARLSLLDRGQQLYKAQQFAAAIQVWQQAAAEFAQTRQTRLLALTENYLAIAYQQLGQWDAAETALNRALNASKTLGDTALEARILNAKGTLYFKRGNPEAALETWQQAEVFYRNSNDTEGIITAQINQAQALQSMGLYRRARIQLERLTQQLASLPDSDLKAAALRSLGGVFQVVGDLPRSHQVLCQSLEISQRLNSPADIAETLMRLGNTARARNDEAAAIQYYKQAREQANFPLTEIQAQLNQLSLYIASNSQSEALAIVREIPENFSALPPSRAAVYARVNFADSAMKISQWEGVESPSKAAIAQQLAAAIHQAQQLNDSRATAYALAQLAHLYEQSERLSDAGELIQRAMEFLADRPNAEGDLWALLQWQSGRILNAQGKINEAIAAYQQAIQTLEYLRQDLVAVDSEVRFTFRDEIEPIYRQFVQLLLQDVDSLSPATQQQRLEASRKAIEALQLRELENFFQEACETYQPKPIEEIDAQAAVIYPILLDNRLEVILSISGQPLQHYGSALSDAERGQFFQDIRQYLNPIFQPQEILPTAQNLYERLVRPAEPTLELHPIETLVFVLDGFLRSLPMSVLHDGKRFLVEKYNIALTPGLQLLESRGLSESRLDLLMGGLAVARQGFTPLPGVIGEIEQIERLISTRILLNEEFTKNRLANQVESRQFDGIHLATHGQFSSKAEETFLLTWDDRIYVKDLDSLLKNRRNRQAIELLVLSACQTAKGDNRAALGLAGVAVRSGARSTLATLWSVQDDSTAQFMAEFYRLLRQGVAKAQALREAQLWLLKNPKYQHPYYWSPFVLVGNWQ